MATGVGAGAAVETGRAPVLVIKVGQNTHLGAAIIMGGAIVAGRTARRHRTEAQHTMIVVSLLSVRRTAAVRWLAVTGGAARMHGLYVAAVTSHTCTGLKTRL